jgi:hypothetical protein
MGPPISSRCLVTFSVASESTAQVDIPQEGAEGVILAQGGRFAGSSLDMKDGKLQYCYNWFNRERYTIESLNRVPTGKTTLRFEFVYDGEGSAREGQRLST